MSDRINAVTVSLDSDIREDDIEDLVTAISMLKGVNGVTVNIVDADTYSATRRVTKSLTDRLYSIINELNKM